MNKAIFLDRDGTINVDYGYVSKVDDLKFIEGVPETLLHLQNKGYLLIIITNQSGVGRGFFTKDDVYRFNEHLSLSLLKKNVKISDFFICFHTPDDLCDCRKPSTKLLLDAKKKYDIDFSKSFMIGDKESDVIAGRSVGVKSFLIDNSNDFKSVAKKILELENE